MSKDFGASSGSHAAHEAPTGLRPSGFDPARVRLRAGDAYVYASVVRSGKEADGSCRVRFDEYTLRSVRKGEAFLTEKNEWTWVKSGFGTRATYGWATSIPGCYRRSFIVGEGAGAGYCRSKSGAARSAVRRLERHRKYWLGKCSESVASIDEEIACLKRWIARARERIAQPTPPPSPPDTNRNG
jgi:hypothetical protein